MTDTIEVTATFSTDGDTNAVFSRWKAFLSSLQYTEAKVQQADYFVYEETQGIMKPIPYSELLRASTNPRGSEDDMFCSAWTPALLDRIQELVDQSNEDFNTIADQFSRIQELEDAIRGHLAHGELNGTKGHENLRAALGEG